MDVRIPSASLSAADAESVFRNPAAQSRGSGFFFREMVRYFHWPFQDTQQEGIEPGPLHSSLRLVTARTFKRFSAHDYGVRRAQTLIDEWANDLGGVTTVNLTQVLRPLIVQLMFELLFERTPTVREIAICDAAAENFNAVLKSTGIAAKNKRRRLYAALVNQVRQGDFHEVFDDALTRNENVDRLAQHFGTTFFFTGVLQVVEYIVHTLALLGQNPDEVGKLRHMLEQGLSPLEPSADRLDFVMREAMRLYPLFGSTNRVATQSFNAQGVTIKQGTPIFLDFGRCHRLQWEAPDRFLPDRWDPASPDYAAEFLRKQHYMPFGVGPRACPAQEFSSRLCRVVVATLLLRVDLLVPDVFEHTRRIALGVPAVLVRRELQTDSNTLQEALNNFSKSCPRSDNDVLYPTSKPLQLLALLWKERLSTSRFSGSFMPSLIMSIQILIRRARHKLSHK